MHPHRHKGYKIKEAKLGRRNAVGIVDRKIREILIDPRLPPPAKLEILIHEHLHRIDWDWPEEKVIKISQDIAGALWAAGYREVSL
jgi:hypothetical protein